jgi:hypothetical protein
MTTYTCNHDSGCTTSYQTNPQLHVCMYGISPQAKSHHFPQTRAVSALSESIKI